MNTTLSSLRPAPAPAGRIPNAADPTDHDPHFQESDIATDKAGVAMRKRLLELAQREAGPNDAGATTSSG